MDFIKNVISSTESTVEDIVVVKATWEKFHRSILERQVCLQSAHNMTWWEIIPPSFHHDGPNDAYIIPQGEISFAIHVGGSTINNLETWCWTNCKHPIYMNYTSFMHWKEQLLLRISSSCTQRNVNKHSTNHNLDWISCHPITLATPSAHNILKLESAYKKSEHIISFTSPLFFVDTGVMVRHLESAFTTPYCWQFGNIDWKYSRQCGRLLAEPVLNR